MLHRALSALFASVSIFLFVPAHVNAADMPVKAAPPPPSVMSPVPVANWTGWYVGASAGYASGRVVTGVPSDVLAGNIKPKGFVGTVLGGYDYEFANNVVLGARLAVPILSISSTTPGPPGFTFQGKVERAVVLAGRLGYAMGDVLPYALGGAVWGRGEGTVSNVGTAHADHTGYIVGGGVEYMFLQHWSLDANYTYVSMSKENYSFGAAGVAQEGYRSNNFTVGVNYRF
jgi:outer membrane immunogenic protein